MFSLVNIHLLIIIMTVSKRNIIHICVTRKSKYILYETIHIYISPNVSAENGVDYLSDWQLMTAGHSLVVLIMIHALNMQQMVCNDILFD